MSRSLVHLGVFLSLLVVLILSNLTPSAIYAEDDNQAEWWHSVPIGTKLYVEVVTPPDAIYREIEPSDNPADWLREENWLLFEQAMHVSAQYRFLNPQHVLRVTVQADGWGLIEPDGQHNPYVPDPLQYHHVYVELRFFRPLTPEAFEPLQVFPDTQPEDKLVVVIRDAHPHLVLFEGEQPVLHVPVVLGPTQPGDYRVYRTRATDDMPGMPAVPFSNYFSGGYSIHGAPWWNWHVTTRGHYGSHGCVNLPDNEWYTLQLDGEHISVAQWVYRWMSTNIDYDEADPNVQQARVDSSQPEWYQATGTVRVIIVENIEELTSHPLPARLGILAQNSQITDWQPLIENFYALDNQWLIMNEDQDDNFSVQHMPSDQSIASLEGITEDSAWVMLDCEDSIQADNLAYEGSSRTVGQVCRHLKIDRQGSVCTPERVDLDYFGEKTLCDASRFNLMYVNERGDLVEREQVYLVQFGGVFKDLHLQGVNIDDPTPGATSYDQLSSVGVTELMSQHLYPESLYAEYYVFLLARPDGNGGITPVNRRASTSEAWEHLRRECDDPNLNDEDVNDLLEAGLMGDTSAYAELTEICSLPPHQLVPDRWIVFE